MYIVELMTTTGKVCESHATYAEARRRAEQFPAGSLVGMPLIFQELADGSQRLVREDGKPLQWHRLPEDGPPMPDEPVPLNDAAPGSFRLVERQPQEMWGDEIEGIEGIEGLE